MEEVWMVLYAVLVAVFFNVLALTILASLILAGLGAAVYLIYQRIRNETDRTDS